MKTKFTQKVYLWVSRRPNQSTKGFGAREAISVLFVLCFIIATGPIREAVAQTVVPYLSTGYRFLVVPQGGGPSGFEQPGFDDSQFSLGDAAFGSPDFCPLDSTVKTPWPLDTDILLRKAFTLPAGGSAQEVGVAIDNDIQVFVNGVDVSGGLRNSENCAFRDRFVFPVPKTLLILGGNNLLAVRARDRGVVSYVDVEVRADSTPPRCTLTAKGTDPSGQRFIQVTCRDRASGLASIEVTKAANFTVSVPAFEVGTTGPVVVTATKVDNSLPASLTFRATDVLENATLFDPVDLQIDRNTGKPVSQTLTGIPQAESKITIYNGNSGLTTLYIEVNGTQFMVAGLRNNEVRDIDVSAAMVEGDNTITVEARGRPGGSATILVHD
jgi:hypothetical protein